MLVLSRKRGQSIMIGDQIEITVLGVEGDNVRIGISAPSEVDIFRQEVYVSIKEENKQSAAPAKDHVQALMAQLQGSFIQKNKE
ncbi:carbon storage regulator CsrA [Paenibacillus urinalis]|uniref:Translational regulator CsrA n=1 Tax=Paenibacillus urinalis TaxID=521520 RepID=A0ABY7X835_9BACL|nr:carbon storage regulator CsrA [Paenibacillus urinalis]WDH98285.1 carbon storage regulator CsrA [Paenibacillus urinalis]WDI01971.1 carbon storage regulator CsrA [Paenibacillus urinalis]